MILIIIGWVIFRADNLSQAYGYIKSMFGISENVLYNSQAIFYLKEYGIYIILGTIFSIPFTHRLHLNFQGFIVKFIKIIVFTFIFIISMSYIIKGTYNPFIYFNF